MNTKSLLVKSAVVAGSFGLLATLGATAASASTGPATVTAVTHQSNAEDTTSGTATGYTDPLYGPVWAYDNLAKQFKVTQTSPGYYTVVETVHGSFTAFSEPNTGLLTDTPINVTGSVEGTNTYYEYSPVAPDPSLLPSQEPSDVHTGAMISALFDGKQVDQGGQSGNLWVFTYRAGGNTMTQRYDTAPNTWGNITG
jgi:hypothetical protein